MSVRNAVLGLLRQKPRHGYELRAAFEAMVGGQDNWDVKPAQIYSTLARLEDAGLVERQATLKDGGPEKRVYTITPRGLAELESWFACPVPTEHQRNEFFLKLMVALATGSDVRQLVYAQRSGLYQELHTLTARRDAADPSTDLAFILLLEQAMAHLEADLRWLEIIETRLDEVAKQPLPVPEVRRRGRPRKNVERQIG